MKNNISVEIAKQLKELGLHAFSLDYWIKPTELNPVWKPELAEADFEFMPYNQEIDSDDEGRALSVMQECCKANSEFWEVYHAYNFAEIRAIVPHNVAVNENIREIGYKKTDSEVDKWGKLLIYLLKNKIITPEDIKKYYF